jgi:hypothetical protein
MADVFLLIVRLLSFYTILYRSVFVNPSTVRTIDGADVGLQFDHHIVRLTGEVCRSSSGTLSLYAVINWPTSSVRREHLASRYSLQ